MHPPPCLHPCMLSMQRRRVCSDVCSHLRTHECEWEAVAPDVCGCVHALTGCLDIWLPGKGASDSVTVTTSQAAGCLDIGAMIKAPRHRCAHIASFRKHHRLSR